MKSSIKLFLILFSIFIFLYSSSIYSDSAKVHNETYFTDASELDSINAISRLGYSIDSILKKNSSILNKTNFALAVYSLDNKKWYYKKNEKKLLTPASTTKLYTTFALLKYLSKDFEIATEVLYDGKISPDGELKGNLYLKGKGDALFSTSDLEILADKVLKAGIKKISGNIIAEPNFFDDVTERMKYSGDNEVVQATPPITSLNIDRNAATIIITAGNQRGVKPNVQIIPASDSHIIINNAAVASPPPPRKKKRRSKKRSSIENLIDLKNNQPYMQSTAGDFTVLLAAVARGGIRVGTKAAPDGRQQFIVSGNIKPNSTYSYRHLLSNPPLTIAGAFKKRLQAGGISINGNIGVLNRKESDSLKQNFKFLTDFRRPAVDIIDIVNKESDNYLAEILFKIIGANAGSQQNTAASSCNIIDSVLYLYNIEYNSCDLNDGSGLSRRNIITAETLIKVLEAAFNMPFKDEFINSLSVAGVDGTLRKRFKNTNAEKNIKAKTGTLRNVSALGGYLKSLNGENMAFALIFNGPNVGSYKMLENEIGALLANFKIDEVKVLHNGNKNAEN